MIEKPCSRMAGSASNAGRTASDDPARANSLWPFSQVVWAEVDDDGVYATELAPDRPGRWTIDISAASEGTIVGAGVLHIDAGPGDAEYFDAGRRSAVLARLAEETGGQAYTPATVSRLPEDLRYTGAGVRITEEHDLWDMPALFLLLVGLIGAEWSYRRLRGLV